MVSNVVNAFKNPTSVQGVETEEKEKDTMGEEKNFDEPIDNGYESFGDYAAIAERIDRLIVERIGYPAHRMNNVADGIAYNKDPDRANNGFAKLCNQKQPFLILRFGKKSEGGHIGAVKQLEFERKLGLQTKRSINHIYRYPNESFIYLKNLAEHDSEKTWEFVKNNLIEAYKVYYKLEI